MIDSGEKDELLRLILKAGGKFALNAMKLIFDLSLFNTTKSAAITARTTQPTCFGDKPELSFSLLNPSLLDLSFLPH